MKVEQAEITLPPDTLSRLMTRKYIQQQYGAVIGSFDPELLIVNAVPPEVSAEEGGFIVWDNYYESVNRRLKKLPSAKDTFEMLLRETVWSHEIVHFHDCVCTPAGISGFIRDWSFIANIYAGLKNLRRGGWHASGPLATDGSAEGVFNLYCNVMLYRLVHNGDIPPFSVPREYGEFDVVWGKIESFGRVFVIPFFPANAAVGGNPACILVPIGFRAITECRAVTAQKMLIRSFGQEHVEMFLRLLSPHFEYRVVNLLLTRVAKKNGLNPHAGSWAADALFRLSGASLAGAHGHSFDRTPGMVLIEILENTSEVELPELSFWQQNVRSAQAARREPDLNPDPAPDDWSGYQIRDYALSSFRRSVDVFASETSGPLPPDGIEWYMVSQSKLPQPLVSFQGSAIGYSDIAGMDKSANQVIVVVAWIMIQSLIEQAIWGDEIVCPVLHGPYRDFLAFAKPHSYCERGIEGGGCGHCRLGVIPADHPKCPFLKLVRDIGLVA
jgi:hypothetical protein